MASPASSGGSKPSEQAMDFGNAESHLPASPEHGEDTKAAILKVKLPSLPLSLSLSLFRLLLVIYFWLQKEGNRKGISGSDHRRLKTPDPKVC